MGPCWQTMDEPGTQGMEFSARLPRSVELPEPVNSNQAFEMSGDKEDIVLVAVWVKVQNHSIYL